MNAELESTIRTLAIVTPLVTLVLGYLFDKSFFSAVMVGVPAAIAGLLCFLGVKFGGWIGLLAAIILVTFLASRFGNTLGKQRGTVFVPGLWLGFCGSCAIGLWAGGRLGLLTITLPSLVIFWGALLGISGRLLPLRDRSQWSKAFRSVLTFNSGTNFPYYVLEDRTLNQRASGSPYGQLFAGPGIVLTGPAHAPVIWDGLKFKNIGNPGLTFTGRFETIYQLVDLRPQLRSFYIDAITKDGIRIKVLTFMPFQLNPAGQVPNLGSSFPLDQESVFRAVRQQPIEDGQKISWDELVRVAATRIMRKIISQYECDELCAPHDPDKDPRAAIRKDLVDQVREEVKEYGIELLGGGISNLDPEDAHVIEKRIEAWRSEWQRDIMVTLGKSRAKAILEIEEAYARTQAYMLSEMREAVEQCQATDLSAMTDMAALRFIEALEEMVCVPHVKEALPAATGETVAYLRSALSHGNPK